MNDKEIIKTFKGNLVDYIAKLKETADKVNQLQSNWNSLREWLDENYKMTDSTYKVVEVWDLLDKMNELEGINNEK